MEQTKPESAMELREYAIAEDNLREHTASMYDAVMRHKKICWWTFLFAMSAVGWYCTHLLLLAGLHLLVFQGLRRPN
jgi:hypothetical protein